MVQTRGHSMLRKFSFIFSIVLSAVFLQNVLHADENKYSYDYNDPKSVVNSACLMLMNSDYQYMLNITDMTEKKRTLQTIDAATNAETRGALLKEAAKITSFELVGIEDFTNNVSNQMMVVTVKWILKVEPQPLENDPEKAMIKSSVKDQKHETTVFTDYLLKKIENKWKIISKKSK